ncbi:MAG: ABC transporter ATP-binding protein [Eubacteriales bacterium]|nr:ABC transporter ATP-binding protein [Eubacteriales bacterium]
MLESKDIVKTYGKKAAVDHFSLTLEEGHIYGMLGPNGSGKSTWMKMVSGLIVPDRGEIRYNDDIVGIETKKQVAYMSTEPFFYSYMKIKDVGKYYRDFFEDFDMEVFESLLKRMELDPELKVRTLSSGMAAKLKIAATMARHAKVYLLDEPFNGIDLLARDQIVSMILERFDDDCIMVISSHMVEELEKIIDSAVFMKNGSLVLAGDVEQIRAERGKSIADLYREIYTA